ncbi:MAG: SpoIID/LytB domain-containing protein [Moorellales bacterium]
MRRLILLILCLLTVSALFPACVRRPGLPAREPLISLYVKERGTVERIKLEDYLVGVVAGEMDPTWPVNALAAQAILARTFTLKKMSEGGVKAHGTDASTDEKEFQAYAPEKANETVRQAVNLTRGLVCTYRGRYINGWFHADAGGRTAASAAEGLAYDREPAPYVHSVADPGFSSSPPENRAWRATFPWTEVRRAVRAVMGRDPGPNPSAAIVSRGPSGRATSIRVGEVTVSGPALRLALGSERMRSTLLTGLAVRNGSLVVEGRGFGHGVGMSQWGAKVLAEQGKSPEEIIRYFFRDVKIERAWR